MSASTDTPAVEQRSGRNRWVVLLVIGGFALGAVLGGVFGSLARGATIEPLLAAAQSDRDAAALHELTTVGECLAIIQALATTVGHLDSGVAAALDGDAGTAATLRQQAADNLDQIDLTTCQVPDQ